MNTLITLKYVDANNCKSLVDFVLSGSITDAQLSTIAKKLDEGECIIADQIGLPTPSRQMAERFDFPTESDHVWTTIEEFQAGVPKAKDLMTELEPSLPDYTVDVFVTSITGIDSWDEVSEMSRVGIS